MKRSVLIDVARLLPAVLSLSQTPRIHDPNLLPEHVQGRHTNADLHGTQLVDGTKGVHAMMPKSIFTK